MIKEDAKRIDQLILESELFNFANSTEYKTYNSFDFSEDIILITGAAGSIGSELSKQIVLGKYKHLVLVDNAESSLYELIKYFECYSPKNVEFVLANITDEKSIHSVFQKYNPTLIFHAAAYKHVPLMEENPYQSIQVNILGTKILGELSIRYNVKKFIFISTDKAVNPINVMGMSKRISENYLEYLNSQNKTTFLIGRFGNIFGSNGSVIPIFKSQIEAEKPITLTNNGMSRYFISKAKAVNLILSLALINSPKYSKFTFDMGKSVKIEDILERLQYFYRKNKAISNFTKTEVQPRSGEKIHEELSSLKEKLHPTSFKEIWAIEPLEIENRSSIELSALEKLSPLTTKSEIKALLKSLI